MAERGRGHCSLTPKEAVADRLPHRQRTPCPGHRSHPGRPWTSETPSAFILVWKGDLYFPGPDQEWNSEADMEQGMGTSPSQEPWWHGARPPPPPNVCFISFEPPDQRLSRYKVHCRFPPRNNVGAGEGRKGSWSPITDHDPFVRENAGRAPGSGARRAGSCPACVPH